MTVAERVARLNSSDTVVLFATREVKSPITRVRLSNHQSRSLCFRSTAGESPMLIVLNCPGCAKRYEIDAGLAGKKSRCKQCGEVFKIPVSTAISAPPAPTSNPGRAAQTSSGGGGWHTPLVEPQRTAKPGIDAAPGTPVSSSADPGSRKIVLNCPNCQKRYELDEALAGRKSRCKSCREVFTIPAPLGRPSEVSRALAVRAAPAPPAYWEPVFEDEPASLPASRSPAVSSYDQG